MYIGIYGWHHFGSGQLAAEYARALQGQKDFQESIWSKEVSHNHTSAVAEEGDASDETEQEEWKELLQKWDEEVERMREENKRYQEWLREVRAAKRRKQKELWEKIALKEYLARQDEIRQLNEKISLERALGEDLYIEKAPLSKSLSVTELLALCGE